MQGIKMRPVSARPQPLIGLAIRYVSRVFDHLLTGTKVDVCELARSRRIHTIELRPLLIDGCLIVAQDGFSVQLSSDRRLFITLDKKKAPPKFNVKQRFTLAHEIAHTLPYDIKLNPPKMNDAVLKTIAEAGGRGTSKSLENFCQIAAGLMLVPSTGLRKNEALGPFGTVDSVDVVLNLAEIFDVSPEVIIHRVATADQEERLTTAYFALIMVRSIRGAEQIRGCIYSATLKGLFDYPRLYSRFNTYVQRTPILREWDVISSRKHEWSKRVGAGFVLGSKRSYDRESDTYFLELRYVPESLPPPVS
jgi:hypothetical protein